MTHTRRTVLHRLGLTAAALTVSRFTPAQAAAATTKKWPTGMSLDVTFTVATKASGRVKRPTSPCGSRTNPGTPSGT